MTIGLTGGVAAGKSEALAALERLGAATISADRIVHDLLDRDPLRARLRERWGDEVVVDGLADREAIGSRVFSDPSELDWLEAEVHPLVRQELKGWLAGLGAGVEFAVAEVPLLFEGGMAGQFDVTVAVVAAEEERRDRASARGQVGLDARERRQLAQQEKAERADHVIVNDGSLEDLERRLGDLLARLATTADGQRSV